MIQAKNQLTPRVYTKSILCVLLLMNMLSVVTATAKSGNRESKNKPATELEKGALEKELKQKIATKQGVSYSKNCLFVENKGQIKDQYQQPRHDIQYSIAAANGLNVFVGNGAIHYQFSKTNSDLSKKILPTDTNGVMYSMYRMDVELVGANKHAVLIPEQQQAYYEYHYTTGNADAKASAYKRITYKEVYPNIDWVLYISAAKENRGTLKHEFVVHKGGRVSDIKLKYSGATSLQIDNNGALTAATPMGTVTEQTPYTYQQDGQQITSSYKLNGNILSYETGAYEGDLTIDPIVAWATYYGGSGSEVGYSVDADNMGNVWLAGYTTSASDIATVGAHDVTILGVYDAFLVKFDNDGIRQWATYFGGNLYDLGYSVAVDSSGNSWLAGYTTSISGIANAESHDQTLDGTHDAFLVKFNSSGVKQWSTYYGGNNNDNGNAVAVDNAGNSWLAGTTYSSNLISSSGSHQTTTGGNADAFLVKFNSSGVRQWGTFYGGSLNEAGNAVAVDEMSNVWLSGTTESSNNISTTGTHQFIKNSGDEAFLVKFDNSGVRKWGTYYGGEGTEYGNSVAVDNLGNSWLVGSTSSASNISTLGTHQTSNGGVLDAFLVKFNTVGVREWATYYGGNMLDDCNSVAVSTKGDVWIAGSTNSISDIATSCAHQTINGGGKDAYITKFNNVGIRQWSTYYGGSGEDVGYSVAINDGGNVYLSGVTISNTNIATPGSYDETYGDGGDAFLVKFTADTLPAAITGITTICVGDTTTLSNVTTCGTWSSSNTSVATIDATTGVVSGMTAGSTNIKYTTAGGIATTVVFVKPLPTVGIVTETTVLCEGSTAKLSGTGATSYSWTGGVTDGVPFVPPVGITTYTVTGYTGTCSNIKTITLTVNPLPTVGTTGGGVTICEGVTVVLSGTGASTYTWTGGVVNGGSHKVPVGTHTFTVTGTDINGCKNTAITTVTVLPRYLFTSSAGPNGTISPLGTVNVCSGETRVYTIVPNAGFHIADVVVNGSSIGAVSSYTLTATSPQTIHATFLTNCTTPPAITGTFTLCSGSSTTLSHVFTGGTWSSSDPEVATIGATSGLLTGVRAGTVVISYFPCPDFYTTTTVTIHPSPSAITGGSIVCVGNTLALTNEESGGIWSSSNPAAATVDTATGIVSGLSTGSTTITYTLPGGCNSTITISVNPAPAAITGLSTPLCEGATATLSTTDASGTWLSATPATATINATGMVTGIAAGTALISYNISAGCSATRIITVNPSPTPILGNAELCAGSTETLSSTPLGGTWNSNTIGIATISTFTGTLSGLLAGTASITYTAASCRRIKIVTVNALPTAITGPLGFCNTSSVTLASTPTGGTWSSSNTDVATVSAMGVVTGITFSTSTISYTAGGCTRTAVVTVNYMPPLSGDTLTCLGSLSGLYHPHMAMGGTWSSSNTAVVATPSSAGLTSGTSAGTSSVTFTNNIGCIATKVVTVNEAVPHISGSFNLCVGASNTLYTVDPATGGTWTSSNTDKAIINPTTGVLTGVSAGTSMITYRLTEGLGCIRTQIATVLALPDSITGTATVCVGATTTLGALPTGNTWSSSNPSVATVSATGMVSGISAGTTIISYTNFTACRSTKIVTVNPLPSAITGPASACPGATIPNTATPVGGTWSLPTFIAFVDPSTGLVYTAASGSAVLSYTLPTGCRSTRTIVVDYEPPSITGITSTFVGGTTTLNNGYGSGVWSSSNPSVATVTPSPFSHVTVNGISIGTATISFTVGSCSRVTVVTVVTPLPSITGTPIVCAGQTNATLGHATAGGTWSSNNTSIATIHPTTGLLTGIANGTTHITYTTSPGIFATIIATVNTLVTNIGETQICPGTTTTLTNAITGGTWSSSNTAVATVNSATGVVTGIVPGTTTINYYRIGCSANTLVSVNPMPVAGTLTGASVVCVGASATLLTKSGAVGTWSSSNAEIANVSTSGIVTGISPSTVTISFTVTNFCGSATATREITVMSMPNAGTITGSAAVCVGATTALIATVSGGTWSSGYAASATVNTTGIVTGTGAGSATISYRMTNYCGTNYATKIITVSPMPNAGTIGGANSVCAGATTTIPFISSVGVWTSSNPSVATINASRVVTGISTGTVTISHTVTNGCGSAVTTKILTVNPLPAAGSLSGAAVICAGTTTSIAPSISGGTWISSNGTKATVNTVGLVTGVSAGSAVISYLISNSCGVAAATHPITVSPAVSVGAIGGVSVVCAGTTATLTNSTAGGTWTSSNTSAATINTSGIITGVSTGTTTISYVVSNSCGTSAASKIITINPQPEAGTISGTTAMCTGTSTTLSNTATGGTWISGGPSAASVSSTGLVTAISAGTVPITYRVINSCGTANAVHYINITTTPTVNVISGSSSVCEGNNITLTNTSSGGTWSSTNTSVATVGSTGTVSALTDGVTTISYTVTNGCGSVSATKVLTVIPLPIAGTITGDATVCRTTTTTLSSSLPGGTWSSSYAAGASVSTTGVVTGLANGSFIISYRMTNSCGNAYATHPIAVISAPSLSTISGAATVCVGATTTLTNITTGGTWTSANTAVATINASTGSATGITSGTAIISYSYTNTCGSATVTRVVTVTPLPVAGTISGTTTLPAGTTSTLSSSIPGGTWLSANGGIASVNASTGVVTGVAAGLATISYISSNSCGSVSTTVAVTVATPATPITGLPVVCENATTTLANATTGGTWSSANTSIATISSAGVLTGIAVGTTHITYSYSVGGFTTTVITVNALPATYTGSGVVCSGSQLNLGSIIPSCLWSSSNTARALVTYTGGLVTGGTSLGTVTITYTNTALCRRVTQLTINGAVASITGVSSPCTGSSITLSNATPGGTWSTSDITKASIHPTTGVFTALSIGSVTVTYRTAANCYKTATTSIGTPPAIAGNANVCLGLISYLTSSGGVWSSGNTAVASVAGNGFVTGVSLGTAVISYRSTANAGCFVTRTVTVHALPSVIVAAPALCPGQTATLTSSPAGGTWTSSYPAKVSVHPVSGLITGLVIDHSIISVANVTYTLPNTCSRSTIVTVNPIPPPIGGINSVCVGSSVTLSNSAEGNTWSSANTTIATISTGGVVLGKEAGVSTISYTNGYGCANTIQVSVHAMPGANTGSATLCVPSGTTTLSNPAGAGTWISSNNSMATVNFNTGVVTGINIGTARITYSKAAGCISVTQVTVTACAARPGMTAETDEDKTSWFTVSPNPTTGAINVTTAAAGSLAIFSIDGMQVLHTYTQAGTTAITLPATLSTGIYMLRYTGNDGNTKTIRLVYTP